MAVKVMNPENASKPKTKKHYHTTVLKDTHIDRIVHYYDLDLYFKPEFNPASGKKTLELFKKIIDLAKSKSPERYQTYGEKAIFIQEVEFESATNLMTGKLRCIRKNILPEIMDMDTDELRELEAKDSEGLLETSHFIISLKNNTPLIALEYNQFGGRINDIVNYLRRIGLDNAILLDAKSVSIVKDELAIIRQRIAKCSEFYIRVHRDNIPEIEAMDNMMYSTIKASAAHFQSEYASIALKFDYKNDDTSVIDGLVHRLLDIFIKSPEKSAALKELKVKAEDTSKAFHLSEFNLLEGKLRSEIRVPKKEKFRTIISKIMFELMKAELVQKRLI